MFTPFRTALAAMLMLGAAGCYFQSETQLIPADKAVDPFGSADFYLVEHLGDEDRGILARTPDNSFHEYQGPDMAVETIYRFQPITDASYMPDAEKYLTTLCAAVETDGCYIVLTTSVNGRMMRVILPDAPEGDTSPRTFTSAEDAISALGEAVRSNQVTIEDYGLVQSMTRENADAWLAQHQVSEPASASEEP